MRSSLSRARAFTHGKRDASVAFTRIRRVRKHRDSRANATSSWVWQSEWRAEDDDSGGERASRNARARTTTSDALSIAPMMEYTTTSFRVMARLLSAKTTVWTEMEVDETVVRAHADARANKFLDYPVNTHRTVLQIGGSDPGNLARATAIAAPYAFDEINLNSGCPSPKVAGRGRFGAALMADPTLVAACLKAMAAEVHESTPVSVKCRIGVDECDSYDDFYRYVETVATKSPTRRFYVHARKALLDGLSPAENRTVPPLRHDWAYAIARDFPECEFHLNGGLKTLGDAKNAMTRGPADGGQIRGAMIGRQAHADPWGLLSAADVEMFGEASNPCASRRVFLERYAEYADETVGRFGMAKDGYRVPSVRHMMHPIQNIFHGCANNKLWRRLVDEELQNRGKRVDTTVASILEATLNAIDDADLDSPPAAASEHAFDCEREWDLPRVGAGYRAR